MTEPQLEADRQVFLDEQLAMEDDRMDRLRRRMAAFDTELRAAAGTEVLASSIRCRLANTIEQAMDRAVARAKHERSFFDRVDGPRSYL